MLSLKVCDVIFDKQSAAIILPIKNFGDKRQNVRLNTLLACSRSFTCRKMFQF